MTGNLPRKNSNDAFDLDVKDIHDIRQLALGNISEEILEISNIVENSIVDLSGEFQKLAQFSKQQAESIARVRDLLKSENIDKGHSTNNMIQGILAETAQVSDYLQQNVNKMVYSIQFQDRTRQLMLAISASLNIIIKISASAHIARGNDHIKGTATISDDTRNVLNQLIDDAAHKELDQNYILRMFVGGLKDNMPPGHEGRAELNDIEFF
ncbi:MAG: hypothetical protein L3J58_04405 [Emcibacter sp.]|nr:hypothetical protein [Emcibacter sp.]